VKWDACRKTKPMIIAIDLFGYKVYEIFASERQVNKAKCAQEVCTYDAYDAGLYVETIPFKIGPQVIYCIMMKEG
jgi:hypothetical protein